MKTNISIFITAFALASIATLSSCQQEEMDDVIVVTDPVLVDTTQTTDPNSCSGLLTFNGGPAPITPSASAYIFNENCATNPYADSLGMTFISIVSDDFDWGFLGPTIGISANGIPGFEFSALVPLQTGIAYNGIGNSIWPGLFSYTGGGVSIIYFYDYVTVELTEAGDEAGENIAGTATFYVLDPATNTYITQESTFCVPIAAVCG